MKWKLIKESFDFGFKVGDMVELMKDKENLITGDVIKAGTVGEVVAVDKPMRGVCKVKFDDGKVSNIPVRSLKKAGEDEPEWKKRATKPKPEPRHSDDDDYGPWSIYNEPARPGYPKWTGD